jgi:hypothetical protein
VALPDVARAARVARALREIVRVSDCDSEWTDFRRGRRRAYILYTDVR